MTQKLTVADKASIKDQLVRELENNLNTIALQIARVAPTLTAENRRVYEDSMSKRTEDLQDQLRQLQASQLRSFGPEEAIADGALVNARFEPTGRPRTESWILILAGISQSRISYKGHQVEVGAGSFGYGGSLLGLRVGESSQVYGDGQSIPDYTVTVLEVL